MNISLIGMSNSGKSYWSQKLEKQGFKRFSIDSLLEEKLSNGLRLLGYKGITDLAKWMRQPYEDRYIRTSTTYLEYEKKTLLEVLAVLEQTKPNENYIVDTTGSVIYMSKPILQKLKQLTTVVYLETPQSVQNEMYAAFIRHPKPIIWGKSFSKKNGETNHEAIKRCYADLLTYRSREYKKLADRTLTYHDVRDSKFTPEKFIEVIAQ